MRSSMHRATRSKTTSLMPLVSRRCTRRATPAGERATTRVGARSNHLPGHRWQRLACATRGLLAGVSRYNERGQLAEKVGLGLDGKPVIHQRGMAGWRIEYDERGREILRDLLRPGWPTALTLEGVAGRRMKYDDRDNVIEVAYFDPSGAPTLHEEGYAVRRMRYDDRHNEIEVAYFGTDGQPVTNASGAALQRSTYDDRNHLRSRSFFGCTGSRPSSASQLVAGWNLSYDDLGRETGISLVGLQGAADGGEKRASPPAASATTCVVT